MPTKGVSARHGDASPPSLPPGASTPGGEPEPQGTPAVPPEPPAARPPRTGFQEGQQLTQHIGFVGAVDFAIRVDLQMETDAHSAVEATGPAPRGTPLETALL